MTAFQWLGPARRTRGALLLYVCAWGLATLYLGLAGGDWLFPALALLLFAIALPALAIRLTRQTRAPAVPVADPPTEAVALLIYVLVFYAIFVLGWLFSQINDVFAADPAHTIVLLVVKLIVHVALPSMLLLALGSPVRALWDTGLGRKGLLPSFAVFAPLLFILVAAVTPSLSRIAATGLSPVQALPFVAGAWLWMSVQAGLCEEYLFRACLQSRLTAWFASPALGLALTAIIFALAHAPGIYLRGGPGTSGWSGDPLQVAAFTIATLSPLAILLGILWLRTRSLLLIALLHGAIDALPHSAALIGMWR